MHLISMQESRKEPMANDAGQRSGNCCRPSPTCLRVMHVMDCAARTAAPRGHRWRGSDSSASYWLVLSDIHISSNRNIPTGKSAVQPCRACTFVLVTITMTASFVPGPVFCGC